MRENSLPKSGWVELSAQPNLYNSTGDLCNRLQGDEKPLIALLSDWPLKHLCSQFTEQGMDVKYTTLAQTLHDEDELKNASALIFCISEGSVHSDMAKYEHLLEKLALNGRNGKRKPSLASAYLIHSAKGTHLLFDLIQLSRLCSITNMMWVPPTELGGMTKTSETMHFVKNIHQCFLHCRIGNDVNCYG